MNKIFICIILGTLQIIFSASSLHSKSWVCDAKAATGFANDRGFKPITYSVNERYIIKDNITADQLSLEHQRQHRIFNNSTKTRYPASIKKIGGKTTELCIHIIWNSNGYESDKINCETMMHGDFIMNIETGLYSSVLNDFQSSFDGSNSWVEVGECRRTN